MISLSRTILALTLQLAVCTPALAQYIDEAAFDQYSAESDTAFDEANAELDKAIATNQRVYMVRACTLLIKAANLKELARNDAPYEYLNAVNTDLTNARIHTNEVCKIANGTTPFPRTDARTDAAINAEKHDLQKGVTWSLEMYRMANSQWEQGKQAAACSTIRAAADELARITGAMRANPELEGAFGNPAQIYQNAQLVAEVRDETFCANHADRENLKRTAVLATEQYLEAMRLWKAGDKPGACAAIRLSATNYAKVTDALTANPTLKSAFDEPDTVTENAAMAIRVRDTMFCKP